MDLLDGEQRRRLLRHHPNAREWFGRLPGIVQSCQRRWEIRISEVFRPGGNASWCAAVRRADGSSAVLKVGIPSAHSDLPGPELYAGGAMVRLFARDVSLRAELLERCEPGIPAGELPATEADDVVAGLLPRLWQPCESAPGVPLLADHVQHNNARLREQAVRHDEPAFAVAADLQDELISGARQDWLLHGDFHAPNVLLSSRGWLAIDPQPMVGDRCYDLAFWLLYRTETDQAARATALSQRLGLDPGRTLGWLAAKSLNYCAWLRERGSVGEYEANLAAGRSLLRVRAGL